MLTTYRLIKLPPDIAGSDRLMNWPGYSQEARENLANEVVDTFHRKLNRDYQIDGQWQPRRAEVRLFDLEVEIIDQGQTTLLRRAAAGLAPDPVGPVEVDLVALIETCYEQVGQYAP